MLTSLSQFYYIQKKMEFVSLLEKENNWAYFCPVQAFLTLLSTEVSNFKIVGTLIAARYREDILTIFIK